MQFNTHPTQTHFTSPNSPPSRYQPHNHQNRFGGFSPSPIRNRKQQLISYSLNNNAQIRRLSSDQEQSRIASPARVSLNSLPPKIPSIEYSKSVQSPMRYTVPKQQYYTTQNTTPSNQSVQIKALLQNNGIKAINLKTDIISEQSLLSVHNFSSDESKSFRAQGKENSIQFKQIRFNKSKQRDGQGELNSIQHIDNQQDVNIDEPQESLQSQKFKETIEHQSEYDYQKQDQVKIQTGRNLLQQYNSRDINNEQKYKSAGTYSTTKLQNQEQQTSCRALNEQVYELEQMVKACQNEQDGFVKSLETKESEILYLKARLQKLQESDLKNKCEINRMNNQIVQLQQDKKNLEVKSQNIIILTSENEGLKNDIEVLQSKRKLLKDEYKYVVEQSKRINCMNETLKNQYQQIQHDIYEIQVRHQALQDEYAQEIEEYKVNASKLCDELNTVKSDFEGAQEEIQHLNDKLEETYYTNQNQLNQLQQQLDEWFKQQIEQEIQKVIEPIVQEKEYYQNQVNEISIRCEGLEDQNKKLLQECEALYSHQERLVEDVNEFEDHVRTLNTQQDTHRQITKGIEQDLQEQLDNNEQLLHQLEQVNAEISNMKNKYGKLEAQIIQQQNTNSELEQINQGLVNKNHQLSAEIQELQNQLMSNNANQDQIKGLTQQLQLVKDLLLEKETEIIRYSTRIQNYEYLVKQLQDTNSNLDKEIAQLYQLIKKRKEDQEQQVAQLNENIKCLQSKPSDVTDQVSKQQNKTTK